MNDRGLEIAYFKTLNWHLKGNILKLKRDSISVIKTIMSNTNEADEII